MISDDMPYERKNCNDEMKEYGDETRFYEYEQYYGHNELR